MNTPIVIVGGGQSGLVAARHVRDRGLQPLVLEAGVRAVGSWPDYYDSLSVFSPAQYSALDGAAFPGDPDHYPHRDEVVAYLERFAASLDVEIRTRTRVERVESDGREFVVHTADGEALPASGIVAASGSFSNPFQPPIPGRERFTGEVLHVAGYREPTKYAGQRIVVVGGGNSAIQVAHELTEHADVTLATLEPVRFLPQVHDGHDVHYWTDVTGFDRLPPEWLARIVSGPLVSDDGVYGAAYASGALQRRQMFGRFDDDGVVWPDGTHEPVDTVILATGYLPSLGYLRDLGALDENGLPRHTGGISTTHPGLVYLGLEFQRSFASNTLRGVGADAAYVVPPLVAYASGASAVVGG
ncbi:flavin-containing monooxygenase [Solicola gregarius]|uniref:NAD(P)/FAD-dependent oxidoreductase n=1 Tax=Solicola gregarius TaxID=2908642 RepID=A0AA46TDY5_9ACTN|nr:NAD(P)/FAD-dependent oxidoreductase [Solicola gregarius]UYM03393.1 NAD(P)/FAD-dependent oxidoreductase [Solicola gregarius]